MGLDLTLLPVKPKEGRFGLDFSLMPVKPEEEQPTLLDLSTMPAQPKSMLDKTKDIGTKFWEEISKPPLNLEALPEQLPIKDYPVAGRVQMGGRAILDSFNKVFTIPNAAIIAASGGLSSIHPLIGKALSAAFGADMSKNAILNLKKYQESLSNGDEKGAWDSGMGFLVDTGFAGGTLKHAFGKPSPAPIRERTAAPEEQEAEQYEPKIHS